MVLLRLSDRYVARHVLYSVLVVLSVLLALFSFIAFFDDKDSIGRNDYDLATAFHFLALMTPTRVVELFPVAALIGSLLGLGTLASNRELMVLRASGVSKTRLVGCALAGVWFILALVLLTAEMVAPHAARHAEQMRREALGAQVATDSRHGIWMRDGRSFVNVRKLGVDGTLNEVFIFEFDSERKLRAATSAQSGAFVDGNWRLRGVVQSLVREDGVKATKLDEAIWQDADFEPRVVSIAGADPRTLSIFGLTQYIDYLAENGLNSARFELAWWKRLFYPLTVSGMIFLALPMVLGRQHSGTLGARILIGTFAGVGFHLVNQLCSRLGLVYGLSPFWSALLPTLLVAGVAAWLLSRSER